MFASCGQKSSEQAPVAGSAAPAAPAPKAAISAPERPVLAGSAETAPSEPVEEAPAEVSPLVVPSTGAPADKTVNPGNEFERQTRDPAWAGPTEIEIQKRIAKLGGRIDRTECRQDRCLIALRGSEDQMGDLIAKLESPDGLAGYAQSIYLSKPVESGGNLVVRAYATFDR
jgi:hypothetical protein